MPDNDKYVLLHRIYPDIWISFSEKLESFPKGEIFCSPRKMFWDNERVGAGAPPLKTPHGWLLFYHGVSKESNDKLIYRLGIMLLDLKKPKRILYRSPEAILSPEESYERSGGLVLNVVFTCGALEWEEKYYIYYGASDGVIGVAFIDKKEIFRKIRESLF